jgi:hypothetical protein
MSLTCTQAILFDDITTKKVGSVVTSAGKAQTAVGQVARVKTLAFSERATQAADRTSKQLAKGNVSR